jgi:hypothetical protein
MKYVDRGQGGQRPVEPTSTGDHRDEVRGFGQ